MQVALGCDIRRNNGELNNRRDISEAWIQKVTSILKNIITCLFRDLPIAMFPSASCAMFVTPNKDQAHKNIFLTSYCFPFIEHNQAC